MISIRTDTPAKPLTPRDIFAGLAFALACALVLADAWRSILSLGWNHEELGYVLLAPLMITWLAYLRRDQFYFCRAQGQWVGLLVLLAGLATYWYGFNTDPVLWRAGAVVALIGAFLATTSADLLLKFSPAFAAAVFLIPVSPNGRFRLAVPLQTATAHATQTVCDFIGIDVERAGSTLSINGVDVAVVEACNGMRMIITLFLVCYVVAFTIPLRPWVRVLFLAASPLVAVVCNVIRLVPTVYLFGHSTHETAERFHDFSGWAMSLVAFAVLLGFCWILHKLTTPDSEPPAAETARPVSHNRPLHTVSS